MSLRAPEQRRSSLWRRAAATAAGVYLLAFACTATAQPDAVYQRVLERVNEARTAGTTCGATVQPPVEPLTWDARLATAAAKHSEDMAAAGVMSHPTPTGAVHYEPGATPAQRVEAEGYAYRTMGENIAVGASSADEVVDLWLASAGHCRNIMNPEFRELGVGRSDAYWTQNFGAQQDAAAAREARSRR